MPVVSLKEVEHPANFTIKDLLEQFPIEWGDQSSRLR